MMYVCMNASFFLFSSITNLIFCSRDPTFFCSTESWLFNCCASTSDWTWIFFFSEINLSLFMSFSDFKLSYYALRRVNESLIRYTYSFFLLSSYFSFLDASIWFFKASSNFYRPKLTVAELSIFISFLWFRIYSFFPLSSDLRFFISLLFLFCSY